MDITIYDLIETAIDKFINQDGDIYSRIVRPATDLNRTVDLLITVRTFAVDSQNIIIEYPNNSVVAIKLPSCNYHKIEVM